MKVVAVIPVCNEEKSIVSVVRQTQKYCDEVIVVDDSSTDRTPQILRELGFKHILHKENKGVGAATRTGVLRALEQGADVVVTLDGDGQHNPSDIPYLLREMGSSDITIGSRFIKQQLGVPAYRSFGIGIVTWLYNFGNKNKVTDALCCLRAFSSESLKAIGIQESGFGFSTETLIKARKRRLRITEVPVNCIYHKDYKQNSVFNPVKLGLILALKTIYWRIKLNG